MSTEYTKTNWQDGDIITADKMNNIENGIKGIEDVTTTVKDGLTAVESDVTDLKEDLNNITEMVKSPNVFNPNTAIEGYQIYSSDGKMYANAIAFTSDFIPVNAGDIIRWYRLTSDDIFYNVHNTVFGGICEYSEANESSFITGTPQTNVYTVQSGKYIRFWNRLEFLQNNKICAVTINKEFTMDTIVPYSEELYPVNNPQVEANTTAIEVLQNDAYALRKVTALDVPYYYTAFINFPMLSGVRTDFYYENELYGAYKRMLGAMCVQVGASLHKDSVSFIPSDSTAFASVSTVYYTNSVGDSNVKTIVKTVKIVKTTDGDGISRKCLLIGDSMTAQGKYQNFANQYFESDGMSVEWLGSRTSQFDLRHEGRSGWRAYTYTHFAQTTASDGEGDATTNAFWNPTTGRFDFSYYMAQQGYDGVDIVFVNLGTNDLARASHSTVAETLESWTTIIDSIHAYDANIQIVLWLCPMPCIMDGIKDGVKRVYNMHKMIMDNFRGNAWGHDNIWILPSFLALDPVYSFPMLKVARNEYDTTLITEPSDTTHPSDVGYHQLANPIIAMIKYLGTLT